MAEPDPTDTPTGGSTSLSVSSSSKESSNPVSSPPSSSSSPPSSTPPPSRSSSVISSSSSDIPSSTPTTTSSPTPPPTPTSTPTTSARSNTGPSVVTSFSTVISSRTGLPSGTAEASESKGFFQNTGAVAGVFSVVGLIGLAIIIALATNTVRRRRAKKFDREIAEAAREAAAAQPPAGFLDDDDNYGPNTYNRSGGGGGASGVGMAYGAYSDASSHGTYNQPPMGPPGGVESYGMREIGPAPGEVFDYGSGAGIAGAAGIGVARARSTRDGGSYGQALQDGASPYAAFAAPTGAGQQQPHRPYTRDYTTRPNEIDLLEAAGMGAHVSGAGAGLARGPSKYNNGSVNNNSAEYDQQGYSSMDLGRNKSLTSAESGSMSMYSGVPSTTASQHYSSRGADAYGSQQYPPSMPVGATGVYQQGQQPQQQHGYNNSQSHAYGSAQGHQRQQSSMDNDMDAYGGYVVGDSTPQPPPPQQQQPPVSPGLPNPFDGMQRRDKKYSVDDDEPKRVLKVANE